LHDDVFYVIMFICDSRQPVVGALLWGSIVSNASVIDNPNIAFVLVGLSCTCGTLVVSWWTTWSLIVSWDALIAVSFLLAISCEVTWFSTEETCEDFPLSVFLDRSSWVSPFSASSYSLFVSISAWEEIFCFGYPGVRPSWGSIHCVWVSLGISPLVIEWFPGIGGRWLWFGSEAFGSVPHVNVYSLLINCCCPPLFVCCGLWEVS
jgi:hypothetical protein